MHTISEAHDKASTGGRAYVLFSRSFSALLIAVVIGLGTLSFRLGIDDGQSGELSPRGFGAFLEAVCAVLSYDHYKAGRYVCDASADTQMRSAGLGYDAAIPEWLSDTKFINTALETAFALPPGAGGRVTATGWGDDAGYEDFVDLAFRLFGYKIQAVYYLYFALLFCSMVLFCAQFWQNHFALFVLASLQYCLFAIMHYVYDLEVDTITNHRFLSTLALIPLLHALLLILYRMRPDRKAMLLFAPQAVLIAAAADFRSLSFGVAIALVISSGLLVFIDTKRQARTIRQGMIRSWPSFVVLLWLAMGGILESAAADVRIPSTGSMRAHTLWEPLYYDLQNNPNWKTKYKFSPQHHGTVGDEVAQAAADYYRTEHNLLHNKSDYQDGNENIGLTQLAYEKYIRAAYIEFALHDPWYVAQTKYYDALSLISNFRHYGFEIWSSLSWLFAMVAFAAWIALVIQVRRRTVSLSTLTSSAAILTLTAILVACPVWALVVKADALCDLLIFGVSVTFVVALWAAVSLTVLAGHGVWRLSNGIGRTMDSSI